MKAEKLLSLTKEIDANKTTSQQIDRKNQPDHPVNTSEPTLEEPNLKLKTKSSFGDLLDSDTFPWHKLAKYGNPCINRSARGIGNFFQKLFYIVVVLGNFTYFDTLFNDITLNNDYYKRAYQNSSCPYYYVFENYTHHLINNTGIESTDIDSDCLYVNPIYFIFYTFNQFVVPTLICFSWFYIMDRRFGALKLRNKRTMIELRKVNLLIQIPAILVMIPVNIVLAFLFPMIFMPIISISILNWICRFRCCSCGCIDKLMNRFFKESEILFIYLMSVLIEVVQTLCNLVEVIASQVHRAIDQNDFQYGFDFVLGLIMFMSLIYRVCNMYANRHQFVIFGEAFNRILPLMLSLWAQGDLILDVIQTKKYYKLAHQNNDYSNKRETYSVSSLYFIFSIVSFIMPVLFSFVMQIYRNKGFKVLKWFSGQKSNALGPTKRFFYLFAEVIIGIPVYFISSVLFCYIIVPVILINHGMTVIRNGANDDLPVDLDPFHIFSRYFNCKGILDCYGLKDFRSKSIPLLTGFEQIGEASIQTVLSFTFIINNYDDIAKLDTFLGVPFPVSIISLSFSIVSLSLGLFKLAKALNEYITKKLEQ